MSDWFLSTCRPDGRPHTVVGVATAEPHGATRWRLS